MAADAFGENDLLVCSEDSIALLNEQVSVSPRSSGGITSALTMTQHLVFVFVSKQTKEGANLADSNRYDALAYTVPQLEPVPSLTLHDVYSGIRIGRRLVVFCSGAVRVLKLNLSGRPSAQMEKRIDVKGIVMGCINRRHATPVLLAATRDEYKLVNLKTGDLVPLFPIMNQLKPHVCPLQSDFLVVQGTGSDEIATGLSITETGEFSKSGIVLQWPSYPTCLKTSGNYVFAVVDNALFTHYIDPLSKEVSENPEGLMLDRKVANIFKLSLPIKVKSDRLVDKLGSDYQEDSDIVFQLHSGELNAWSPPPLLLDLEVHIRKNEDVDLNGAQINAVGKQYLILCKLLMLLLNSRVDAAVKHMKMLDKLDPSLVFYIYNLVSLYTSEIPPETLFPGLIDLAKDLRAKAARNELNTQFLKVFLHKELKQHSGQLTRPAMELEYAQLLSDTELTRFLLTKTLSSRTNLLKWLKETKKYAVLEQVYSISGESEPLFDLWQTIIKDPKSRTEDVQQAANSMVSYFTSTNSKPLSSVLPTVLDLVTTDLVSVKLGLQVLQSKAVEQEDPLKILDLLKERSESGPIWRAYLKHVVYTKNILKDDLASLIVTDLIESVQTHKACVQNAYARFADLRWPKPSYKSWLLGYIETVEGANYSRALLKQQQEFWALVEKGLDCQTQLMTFESQLECMKYERVIIYERLGLHEQALTLLCAYTDFRSVITYASRAVTGLETSERETRDSLAYLALKSVLKSPNDEIVSELLLVNKRSISLTQLLNAVNEDMLFRTIAEYTISELDWLTATEAKAQLQHAVLKSLMNT